jgi:hypothetical protein
MHGDYKCGSVQAYYVINLNTPWCFSSRKKEVFPIIIYKENLREKFIGKIYGEKYK